MPTLPFFDVLSPFKSLGLGLNPPRPSCDLDAPTPWLLSDSQRVSPAGGSALFFVKHVWVFYKLSQTSFSLPE